LKVTVYRLQLFKPSEGFIAGQARALPTASVQLIGRAIFGPPDPSLPYWVPPKLGGTSLSRFLLTSFPGRFESAVKEHGSHLIHAHFSIDALYALALARRMDRPLITTLHGFDVTTTRSYLLQSGSPAWVRYALLQNRLKRSGTHFVCVSRFIYEAALRAGFPENRLSVHYIGVDTKKFAQSFATQPPRVVHVARLVEKKGTRYLVDAMAQLHRKFPELTLDIIGDGTLRKILHAQVERLGIGRNVRFHGTQSQDVVRTMLIGATALVLPSVTARSGDAEGLGLVLLEASAGGVPVIGTRHGGIPEAMVENETGLLVRERDSLSLADAIDTLVSAPTLQRSMGEAARQLACERFDIHRQSAKLESVYRSVC
jgi:colanic acid/amylovoran biosynthesis glycosyltransferase